VRRRPIASGSSTRSFLRLISSRAPRPFLKKIASNAPDRVKFAIEAANRGMDASQGEGLLLEASYFGLCAATEEQEGRYVRFPRETCAPVPRAVKKCRAHNHSGETHGKRQYFLRTEGGGLGEFIAVPAPQ